MQAPWKRHGTGALPEPYARPTSTTSKVHSECIPQKRFRRTAGEADIDDATTELYSKVVVLMAESGTDHCGIKDEFLQWCNLRKVRSGVTSQNNIFLLTLAIILS